MKIGGTCYVKSGGTQFPIAGSVTVRPAKKDRQPKVGLDGAVRWTETPVSPSIEIECMTPEDFDIKAAMAIENGTVVAELANGKTWTLTEAFHSGAPDINAAEGTVTLLYHGQDLV